MPSSIAPSWAEVNPGMKQLGGCTCDSVSVNVLLMERGRATLFRGFSARASTDSGLETSPGEDLPWMS